MKAFVVTGSKDSWTASPAARADQLINLFVFMATFCRRSLLVNYVIHHTARN